MPTVRLLFKKSPCPAKIPTPLHTSQKSRYSRCHCFENSRLNMAPSVLVDQSEQAAVAVATKSLDCRVIKPSLPNPSLQVTADHRLKSVEAPVYAPGQGEVLVHIKATGICGSDIHFWKTGRIGSLVFEGDCIIGHEASGIVLRCGEGVSHLKPGKKKIRCYHFVTNIPGANLYLIKATAWPSSPVFHVSIVSSVMKDDTIYAKTSNSQESTPTMARFSDTKCTQPSGCTNYRIMSHSPREPYLSLSPWLCTASRWQGSASAAAS